MLRLHLFEGGYCTHRQKMALRKGSLETVTFPSIFGVIEHPHQGVILFDTGYSPHFFSATSPFPERAYRWVTPVVLHSHETAVAHLQRLGYRPEDVTHVIISHFHGDHVSALRDFPRARFVFLNSGYTHVSALNRLQGVSIGYLKALLPPDFDSRAIALDLKDSRYRTELPAPLGDGLDLFQDGSIRLVPLEGHFAGQVGALLNTDLGTVFLIADACWFRQSFEELALPHPIAMTRMYNPKQYVQDLQAIQGFYRRFPHGHIIPSHCRESKAIYDQGVRHDDSQSRDAQHAAGL